MIGVEEAVALANKHFPEGPEKLAECLGVTVRHSSLTGCDGWCLAAGGRAVIRIHSGLAKSRQRFTLAHELGHLLLAVPSIVGESLSDILSSNDAEERRVNELAAELLIPRAVVRATVCDLPVVAKVLRRLARKARVSELTAALRIANLARDLGLGGACVVFFEGREVAWQWSQTLTLSTETAIRLRTESQAAAPGACRHVRKDQGDVMIASLIEKPIFGSATMLVQLLPAEYETQKPRT
jgi:hypothetical protein